MKNKDTERERQKESEREGTKQRKSERDTQRDIEREGTSSDFCAVLISRLYCDLLITPYASASEMLPLWSKSRISNNSLTHLPHIR